jgi:ABC-type uncharacterized transport system involved in gliding motility auxiliary subunit
LALMLDSLRRQLPAIFTILGLLSLVLCGGLYLVYNEANRWVLTAGAIGLIFIVYAILERPEVVRESVTGREVRYGANSLVMTVAFIGIVGLLNFLGARHTYQWDLTESKDFSLSPQTIQVLQQINSPVKVTAFYQQGQSGQEELQDLLKQYQRYSDKISYEFVDPVLKPGVARDYNVESYGTTVIESEGRRQNVATASEGDITSALVKLERGQPKRVGWVTGHGELDTESFDRAGASEAKRLIELENYKIEPLTLLSTTEIPADMAAVVLAGPRQPLLPQENDVLKKYLDKGGKLLVMVEPRSPGNPTDLLKAQGIEVGDGIVLDFVRNLQGDPLTPAVVQYPTNPVMKAAPGDASGRYVTVLPGSTMVRARADKDAAISVTTIAESGPERSWLESDQRIDVRTVQFDDGKDVKGPVPLAVAATRGAPGAAAGAAPGAGGTLVVAIDQQSPLRRGRAGQPRPAAQLGQLAGRGRVADGGALEAVDRSLALPLGDAAEPPARLEHALPAARRARDRGLRLVDATLRAGGR